MSRVWRAIATGPAVWATGRGVWSKGSRVAAVFLAGTLLFGGLTKPVSAQCTGCTNASFGPAGRLYPFIHAFGGYPSQIASADFNGDGIPDFAALEAGRYVRILLGTGSGGFLEATNFPLASFSAGFAVGDIDGDGIPDLLVARPGSTDDDSDPGDITILFGNGSGGIRSQRSASAGLHPYALITADFDGDGILDVAVTGRGGLEILPARGDGTFRAPVVLPAPPSSYANQVFTADFDGDGLTDLLLVHERAGAYVYFGMGGGTLSEPTLVSAPTAVPFAVQALVADLDGDGLSDIVIADRVYFGSASREFGSPQVLYDSIAPGRPIGDFNNDGAPDLILSGTGGSSIAFGDGRGGFLVGPFLPQLGSPVLVGDFDGDGVDDFVFDTYGNLGFVRGVGNGVFEKPFTTLTPESPQGFVVGDFNGDGKNDLAAAFSADHIGIMFGNGDGTFQPPIETAVPSGIWTLAAGDLNRDHHLDLVAASNDTVLVLLGDGAGHFSLATQMRLSVSGVTTPVVADFNRDGRPDVVVRGGYQLWLMVGNGSGGLGTPAAFGSADNGPFLADLNHDGRPDLVTSYFNSIRSYIGDGAGHFTEHLGPNLFGYSLAIGDFDGDGNQDLAVSGYGLNVLLGDGRGNFGPPQMFSWPQSFGSLAAGDFDGDGKTEIAADNGPGVTLFRYQRSLGITAIGSFLTPGGVSIAADFTGDGKPDLLGSLYTNYVGPSGVWVAANTTCKPRLLSISRNVSSCDIAGSPFAVQPTVRVTDDGDNVLTCASASVTASIVPGSGAPGAALGGTTSVPIVSGLATFTNLSINLPGGGYQLEFSDSALHGTRSREFSQSLPAPAISSPAVSCQQTPDRFEAAVGYDTYLWTLDTTVVGHDRILTLAGIPPGPHTLHLTVSLDGCSSSTAIGLTPSPTPATPVATNNGPVSLGATLQLSSSMVPGASYLWSGPNGFTSNQQNPSIPNAGAEIAGIYSVTAIVGGCPSAAASTTVNILPRPWCPGCRNASFGLTPEAFETAAPLLGLTVGDFDGDGDLDVVVSHRGSTSSITFYPGDGRGGFGASIDAPTSPYLGEIISADFNEDGLSDVILTDYAQSYLLIATGGGHFAPPQGIPGLLNPITADVNGDGHQDLIGSSTTSTGIVVLLGDGKGSFLPPVTYPTTAPPSRFRVLDINGDHRPDIIAITGYQSISILLGNALGGFIALPDIPVPGNSIFLAVGDLDGDSIPDLAILTSGFTESIVSIYAGAGNGQFTLVRYLSVPVFASQLEIHDINGDGKNDILFLSGGIGAFLGRGGFDFDPMTIYPAGSPVEYRVVDLDRDGRLDAVVASSQSIVFLRGNGKDGFSRPPNFPAQGAITVADFDRNGHPDVAVAHDNPDFRTGTLSILLNDGFGGFTPGVPVTIGLYSTALVAADFNGDGYPDVVIAQGFYGGMSVILSDGHGGFGAPVTYPIGALALAVGDFNGDGKRDLAVADSVQISILLGDGLGNLTVASTIPAYAGSLAAKDFNQDGRDDLVAVLTFPTSVSLFLAQPDGSFGAPTNVPLSISLSPSPGVAVDDFNKDGNLDVAVGGDQLAILLGDGKGALSGPNLFASSGGPGRAVSGDFNGDGNVDLAVINDNVALFNGDGSGAFAPSTRFAVVGSPGGIGVADFNGDGKPDLVISDFSGGVEELLNTNCVPRRLGATILPNCSQPGTPLAPAPAVSVFDDGRNVVACDSLAVTASIAPGTGAPGALLGGTKSVNAVGGTVNFTTLSIDRAGVGYQLEFHHPVASPARTGPFSVGNPPVPPTAGSNGPVCLGQTLQLTASAIAGGIYRWTGPNGFAATVQNPSIPSVTVAAAGTYSVTVEVNGCTSAASTTNVLVLPLPPPATITAPNAACPNSGGYAASTPDAGPGATYSWSISNGTITSGNGTSSITFSSGYIGQTNLSVVVTGSNGCSTTATASINVAATCAMSFYTLPPCRVVDTRNASGPYGGPPLSYYITRNFVLTNQCGIPATALAVSANVTVTQPGAPGDLRIFAGGTPWLVSQVINYGSGQTRANNAILALGINGDIEVGCDQYPGTVQFILDVNGYFQ